MTKRFKIMVLLLCLFSLLVGGCSSQGNSPQEARGLEQIPAFSQPEQSLAPAGSQLKIHFIDVGQGDAILIQSPQGENLLIDGGEKDEGKEVATYLRSLGVEQLAAIIGTHPHADHIGGLIEVIDDFPVAKVYLPSVTHSSQTFEDLLLAIKNKQLKISKASAGVKIPLKGLQAEFLAPRAGKYEELNNYSAVVKLSYGQNVFLLMGDAEKESEEEIMQTYSDIKADLIKLGHHGSSSSSIPAFLAAVSPKYAVIMCGVANDYGHPHQETLASLSKLGVEVYRTDQDGSIVIASDGKRLSVSSDRGKKALDSPNAALLNTSAAADSKSNPAGIVIGNKNSKKFHRPGCKNLPEMQNRVIFSKREEAITQGYAPCKICRP